MRVLFTSAGGRGHSDPLVPIARAARAADHEVAFCCRPPMAATIEADGFPAFTAGPDVFAPAQIGPLAPLDSERELRVLRDGFAGRGIAARRAAELPALFSSFRPDVVVCDETDFGALVAAERHDLPYASVVVVASGSFLRPDVIRDPLATLRAEHGLAPDPDLAMLTRYCVFAPGPPSFRDPSDPPGRTAHPIRPAALDGAERGPAGPGLTGDLVYFTLGSVFNLESGDLFARVLRGLRELPIDVVATVGAAIDPSTLGPQPPNIRVERFVAQATVLPHCRAVVSHGGSGTVIGALAHGVPQVVLPMGADQPNNAARCEALGVGITLDASTCSSTDVRDAVNRILDDPSFRERAASLRAETLALPGPDHAVELLEQLATERRPILRNN